MIDKITIRTQGLHLILIQGMTVRGMSAFCWQFPVHEVSELSNLLNILLS